MITEVVLPPEIEAIYNEKIFSEQLIEVQKNKLEKETIEAERLKVEALAKANYNLIIDSTLTDNIIKLKYIETLKEILKSPASKTIILDGNNPELIKIIEGKKN